MRERERLVARMKMEREKREMMREVEVKVNGVLSGKRDRKGKEREREVDGGVDGDGTGKGKGKQKEVEVGVEEDSVDVCDGRDKLAVKANGRGKATKAKRKASEGARVESDALIDEAQEGNVELKTQSASRDSSDVVEGAREVNEEENVDRLRLEGFAINGTITDAGSSTGDPSASCSVSSNGMNDTTGTHGQQPQTASSSSSVLPVRRRPRRFLRVRDFNPYSLKLAEAEEAAEHQNVMTTQVNGTHTDSILASSIGKGKGKQRALPSPSPPLPHLYSYPYPIHLNINSAFSHPYLSDGSSVIPYTPSPSPSLSEALPNSSPNAAISNSDRKSNIWGKRRVVREPSITPVKGVFKKDIVSWLPYTEVVSEETFEVTDVMMDDCRLLLLKVCRSFPASFSPFSFRRFFRNVPSLTWPFWLRVEPFRSVVPAISTVKGMVLTSDVGELGAPSTSTSFHCLLLPFCHWTLLSWQSLHHNHRQENTIDPSLVFFLLFHPPIAFTSLPNLLFRSLLLTCILNFLMAALETHIILLLAGADGQT